MPQYEYEPYERARDPVLTVFRLLLVTLVGCWGVENYPNPSDVDLTRSRLLVGRGAQEQF